MKITLILVGKTEEKYLIEGINKYIERLNHYINFNYIVIGELKNTKNLTETQIKLKEGDLIKKQLKNSDTVILLDEKGKQYDSIEFSAYIEKHILSSTQHLVFIIGGAYGFDKTIYERANFKISLSKMTFSHQMIRLFFIEQLYRAFTIMKNEPYHHK